MQTERRLYPRYLVDLPVRLFIGAPDGEVEFVATALNLSQGGIQLSCKREVVTSLLEQEEYPPVCRLAFSGGKDQGYVDTRGRLVVNRRMAEDCHHLGFAFINLDGRSRKTLIEFLERL